MGFGGGEQKVFFSSSFLPLQSITTTFLQSPHQLS